MEVELEVVHWVVFAEIKNEDHEDLHYGKGLECTFAFSLHKAP